MSTYKTKKRKLIEAYDKLEILNKESKKLSETIDTIAKEILADTSGNTAPDLFLEYVMTKGNVAYYKANNRLFIYEYEPDTGTFDLFPVDNNGKKQHEDYNKCGKIRTIEKAAGGTKYDEELNDMLSDSFGGFGSDMEWFVETKLKGGTGRY